MLNNKEKKALRAQGNRLKAELWIGKFGISDGTVHSLLNAFSTKELVKIKLLENTPTEKNETAETLCNRADAELVQIIGNTLLLYKELPEA